jgi:hypothetical protein
MLRCSGQQISCRPKHRVLLESRVTNLGNLFHDYKVGTNMALHHEEQEMQ